MNSDPRKDRPKTIFLVGDSTVQSYSPAKMPITGWGQQLYQYFAKGPVRILHSEGSRFEEAVTYEMEGLRIDNRAVMARSTKTFLEEGRMEELLPVLRPGDLLLIQFGHNDANEELTERYVTTDQYKEKLTEGFVLPAKERGTRPVLVTPIAQRVFDEEGRCRISFPEYREAMLELAAEYSLPVIDLGKITADYNTRIGPEGCKGIYLYLYPGLHESWIEGTADNTHLQYAGAYLYAGFVAEELRRMGLVDSEKET